MACLLVVTPGGVTRVGLLTPATQSAPAFCTCIVYESLLSKGLFFGALTPFFVFFVSRCAALDREENVVFFLRAADWSLVLKRASIPSSSIGHNLCSRFQGVHAEPKGTEGGYPLDRGSQPTCDTNRRSGGLRVGGAPRDSLLSLGSPTVSHCSVSHRVKRNWKFHCKPSRISTRDAEGIVQAEGVELLVK